MPASSRLRFAIGIAAVALGATACGGAAPATNTSDPTRDPALYATRAARTPTLQPCPQPAASGPALQRVAPLALPCLDRGPAVDIGRGRGRPLLINVWASWCTICQKEMPLLQAVSRAAGDRVEFLGVDIEDTRGSARDFLAATGATYPSVFDPAGKARAAVRSAAIPTTLVFDAAGRLVFTRFGALSTRDLRSTLGRFGVTLPAKLPPAAG